MPGENDDEEQLRTEGSKDASVDDMAAAVARQLKTYQDEDGLLAEEEKVIKARRKWLKAEIDKAQRMTRSLIPRQRVKKAVEAEVNPPVQQQPVQEQEIQTQPVRQASAAPAFKPE